MLWELFGAFCSDCGIYSGVQASLGDLLGVGRADGHRLEPAALLGDYVEQYEEGCNGFPWRDGEQLAAVDFDCHFNKSCLLTTRLKVKKRLTYLKVIILSIQVQ